MINIGKYAIIMSFAKSIRSFREVKADGLRGKWTVKLDEIGRSKSPKVDGLGSKWTVYESGWSKTRNGRSIKNETGRSSRVRGRSKGMKVDA